MNNIELLREENKVYCTSLQIAECFDKRHNNVLQLIRNKIVELPTEFALMNYKQTSYKDSQNKTGYNLKWNKQFVLDLMTKHLKEQIIKD